MQRIGMTLSCVAILGVLFSPAARVAAEQNPRHQTDQARIQDIRLTHNGVFQGTVQDDGGQPLAEQDVHVYGGKKFAVTTRTNKDGQFRVATAIGGTYRIKVRDSIWFCRCWTGDAAPPGAIDSLAITASGPAAEAVILRGQKPLCCLWGGEPLMLGVLIAAAIAIPIAVHNSDSDDAS